MGKYRIQDEILWGLKGCQHRLANSVKRIIKNLDRMS